MPRTGSLLNDVERVDFTRWLTRIVEAAARRGISKKTLSRALNADSNARLNRYLALDGTAQIPTAHVLAKLCKALDVSWVEAFWRAGYYAELLGYLDQVARMLEDSRVGRSMALQMLMGEIVRLAIHAFPRRDLASPGAATDLFELLPEYNRNNYSEAMSFLQAHAPINATDVARMSADLDPKLNLAVDALRQHQIPTETRRAIAGEYVNAWAETIVSEHVIEAIRGNIRKRFAVPA